LRKIDFQERLIIKELIDNPRISDNQISKNTGLPLKSVNRKRKKLEDEGLLQYFTYLDTSRHGTGDFETRQLYIIKLRSGITRKLFFERFPLIKNKNVFIKHILESHIGEHNGMLTLLMILESRLESDIIEIFNADIVKILDEAFGHGSVIDVMNIRLSHMLNMFHNYIPSKHIKDGLIPKVKKDDYFIVDQNIGERQRQ